MKLVKSPEESRLLIQETSEKGGFFFNVFKNISC